MFFRLFVSHYALSLIQFYCRLKVGLNNFIYSGCLALPHSNVWSYGILYRLVIGFGLELDFLSILVAKKAVIQHLWRPCATTCRVAAHLSGIFWDQMDSIRVIMVDVDRIFLYSNVATGADYRLYLTPKYVETGF